MFLRVPRFAIASPLLWSFVTAQPAPQIQAGRPDVPPPHEDCLPYNVSALTIVRRIGWTLTDGRSQMAGVGNQPDGENALALAQRYSSHCFIGRHASTRPNVPRGPHRDYIIDYWKGSTGKTTTISPETCTSYAPARLAASDKGSKGWIVSDGAALTLTLDNERDASAALALARQFTARCTIGSGNLHIDYWK
jgi:hypothetical protein